MTISYEVDRDNRILHVIVTAPTVIGDYQSIMPSMIREISDCGTISLLLEVRRFLSDEGYDGHDLGFYFLNQIKNNVARLAIACPKEFHGEAAELMQLIQNHGRPAEIFQSIGDAREWLSK